MSIEGLRASREPPYTEPYVRWCGSWERATSPQFSLLRAGPRPMKLQVLDVELGAAQPQLERERRGGTAVGVVTRPRRSRPRQRREIDLRGRVQFVAIREPLS